MKQIIANIVLVLVLAATPVVILAQGDDEFEMFTSEDGLFSVNYPADWFVFTDEQSPFPMIVSVNTKEALQRVEVDADLESGDKGFVIFVVPVDLLALIGLTLPADASPAEITVLLAETLYQPEPAADGTVSEDESAEFGEPEEIELAEDRLAGSVSVLSPKDQQEGVFMTFSPAEGLLAVIFAVAFPGEFEEEQAEAGAAIAASLVYEGSAEDIMAVLMEVAAEVQESAPTGGLDGAALVAERCSVCHTTDRIDRANKDVAGWTRTVDEMIGKGARLNSAEREAVIAYLSSR